MTMTDDGSVFDFETVAVECTCFSGCNLCWWSGVRYITWRINRSDDEISDIDDKTIPSDRVKPTLLRES
ncbi:hypothetical protein ACE1CI_15550 [Aerosakkonemataceae cyanobacterium BLCC-F50]|uniref:Uncharacterized protein n=1 Tax=Floridaenema flaviceps BLCC-F50 TaxID=3153642 RepID=A0ABV4XRH5_9CYAN